MRARRGAGWKGAREYGEDRSGDRRALGGGWVDLDCSSGEPLDGWRRWEIWMWGRRAPGKGRADGGATGGGGGGTGRECRAWHETTDEEIKGEVESEKAKDPHVENTALY